MEQCFLFYVINVCIITDVIYVTNYSFLLPLLVFLSVLISICQYLRRKSDLTYLKLFSHYNDYNVEYELNIIISGSPDI